MSRNPEGGTTLVLSKSYVAGCAASIDYIRAVETAFQALGAGAIESLPVGHVPAVDGGFHIKAAATQGGDARVAIKINANFPGNPRLRALPTIQGCIVLSDGVDGRLLAIMDTVEITAQRTAAASALAARHLARSGSHTVAFVGCGTQAGYHLDALLALEHFPIRALRCFDTELAHAEGLRSRGAGLGPEAITCGSPGAACRGADIIVTTTPSTAALLHCDDIVPGTFIAAVGADNPSKCELDPELMARARVVTDITAQAECMGDLRAAIAAGTMRASDVHAELAAVVCGTRPARTRDDEIFVFDSTGTAIEDLAAAVMVFERASADPRAPRIVLNS